MKVFISAAEASSDTHAAEVLKRLFPLAKEQGTVIEAFGIGGPKLRAAGLKPLFPAEDLLAMGFVEVLTRLPKIYRYLNELEAWAKRERPAVAILCDYPEFHFKLAARLKKLGIRTICFIPPKVWVWRKKRIALLAQLYDRVLSILPFEEKTYEGSSVKFEYVGNPLMDELPVTLARETARKSLALSQDDRMVALLAGSRPAELSLHLEPMIRAATMISSRRVGICFRMPLPEALDLKRYQALLREVIDRIPGARDLDLKVSQGDAWTVLRAADAAIIKSGTSSLEAAILDCPHVVIYRAHPISEWIYQYVIRYAGSISLTNLILDRKKQDRVVKELILEDFSPEKMADEVLEVLKDSGKMRTAFAEIRNRLEATGSPSLRVAEVILEEAL